MLGGLLTKIVGDANKRVLKPLYHIVDEINSLEEELMSLDDDDLRGVTEKLTALYDEGDDLYTLLPYAFAAVREAARRNLGMRHFDVQLLGGMVLHKGNIAEMGTGEGKTLVATLPAYLNSITGKGVHIVTVNDYLARRDASWMGAVYYALGVKVGCVQNNASFIYDPEAAALLEKDTTDKRSEDASTSFIDVAGDNLVPAEKKDVYACDIVYGTNNEFGFDYLRDNMAITPEQACQRSLSFAIVDEVDNVLIDEARTPLIISGPAPDVQNEYNRFARLAKQLDLDVDYEVDIKRRDVTLTEEGVEEIERIMKVENLYAPENQEMSHFVENAIRAESVYRRDTEYVVQGSQVMLVDEFTGRLMQGRRLSDGMHQALEAKEGVKIQRETRTYATITLQNYFRMYDKLAGMTGTATTEAEEFQKIYKLEVIEIPTNRDFIRKDTPDQIYMTEKAKWRAVVEKVLLLQKEDIPVLVGTTSIEKSEHLSNMLSKRGVKVNVLNARNHENEAAIIAQSGNPGSVTVSTNMAGRGTDIILGGNPNAQKLSNQEWKRRHDAIIEKGGLFVIGTERHESRRIDNQLRGRAGRQGDPGHTQFFTSTEDELIKRFGGDRIRGTMNMLKWDENEPMQNRVISRSIESAQTKVEAHHFEIRKNLVDYDDVINTQRSVIYELRRRALKQEDLRNTIFGYLEKEIAKVVSERMQGSPENWEADMLRRDMLRISSELALAIDDVEATAETSEEISAHLIDKARKLYDHREEEFTPREFRKLERLILLRTIDEAWVEHLTLMDGMRQGIGLEAVGQRDPLVQYKRQTYGMFADLVGRIEGTVARTVFNAAPARTMPPAQIPRLTHSNGTGRSRISAKTAATLVAAKKIGRNDPCTCGSGKKYKKCHGAN